MDGELDGGVPKRSTDEEAIRAIKHAPADRRMQRWTSQAQCTVAKQKSKKNNGGAKKHRDSATEPTRGARQWKQQMQRGRVGS